MTRFEIASLRVQNDFSVSKCVREHHKSKGGGKKTVLSISYYDFLLLLKGFVLYTQMQGYFVSFMKIINFLQTQMQVVFFCKFFYKNYGPLHVKTQQILYLKMCFLVKLFFLVDFFFLIDFYMKRPLILNWFIFAILCYLMIQF